MPPIVSAFHASKLESHLNTLPPGKTRKPAIEDLQADCALKEMLQYNCDLRGPREDPKTKVVCKPVLRLFRQCANGLTVETTSWEDRYDGPEESGKT